MNVEYKGCFGGTCFSDRKSIEFLWKTIDCQFYIDYPNRYIALQDFERSLGIYSTFLENGSNIPSLCNNIFDLLHSFKPWYNNHSLKDVHSLFKSYKYPFIKILLKRFE